MLYPVWNFIMAYYICTILRVTFVVLYEIRMYYQIYLFSIALKNYHTIQMSYVCTTNVLYFVVLMCIPMYYLRITKAIWDSVAHDVNRHRYLSL